MEFSGSTLEDGLLSAIMADETSGNMRNEAGAGANGAASGQHESLYYTESELEYLSVDNMLVKYVGEFGWAQLWHFVLVCAAWVPSSMYKMVMIFSDRIPEWQCICTASSSICEMDRGLWEWVGGRTATTVSEWDLICGDEYKAGLVGSLFFVGVLLGGGIWGNVSDSFLGRKRTFTLSLISAVILALLTSVAPSFWVYTLLRFLTGVSCSGITQCTFVLATEVVGPSKRGSAGMSAFYFFSAGVMILPFFGYFATHWRVLYFAIALFNAVYCVLVLPFLHESPRWYLVKGRVEDAMKVLRSFAKWNGNLVPDSTCLAVDLDISKSSSVRAGRAKEVDILRSHHGSGNAIGLPVRLDSSLSVRLLTQGSRATGTLVDVFRCKETRQRMFLMMCVWFSTGLVYYGISLNVVNLDVNLYVSVFLNGLIEIPALAITAAVSNKLGRRVVQVGSMSLSGFCCLVGSLLFITSVPSPPAGVTWSFINPKPQTSFNPGLFLLPGTLDSSNISSWSNIFEMDHSSSSAAGQSGGDYELSSWSFSSTANLMAILRLVCGVMGLFGMAGSYNVLYIYTTELFPTVVRNAVLGLGVQAAGIGSVGGPIIAVLGRICPPLPFVIFGVLAMTGAALGSNLPETLGQPLCETMEEMEALQRNQRIEKETARTQNCGHTNYTDHYMDHHCPA